jgi:biopolymer transport protein ExbB
VEATLPADGWHAVGVTVGERLILYVDGREAASASVQAPKLDGAAVLGASAGRPAFAGVLDALRLSNAVRPAGWFLLERDVQSPESTIVRLGGDESRSDGGWQTELSLIRQLMGSVTIDGWIVIALIGMLGLLSADVWIRKTRLVGATERADREFLAGFSAEWQRDAALLGTGGAGPPGDETPADSVLRRLYRVTIAEVAALPATAGRRRITPEALAVIRGSLNTTVVEESERLQRRLVLMTIAVSGGPFLGLLGTVVGVMITFASIAASGDVNVNTIAPGIAAALFATVVGLLVAIPSLFGYNFLATRIAARVAAMEVFADGLIGRVQAAFGQSGVPMEMAHAA